MEEQSRMDNPKPLATFGTQDTGRRQTKHNKQQQAKMSTTDATKNRMKLVARER